MKPRALKQGDRVKVVRSVFVDLVGEVGTVIGRHELDRRGWNVAVRGGWYGFRRSHLRALPRRQKGGRHA